MKKLFTMILALALMASLFVGCGEKIPSTDSESSTVLFTDLVTDQFTNDPYPHGYYRNPTLGKIRIPQINLDSADIDRINKEIAENYSYLKESDSISHWLDWKLEYSGNNRYALIISHGCDAYNTNTEELSLEVSYSVYNFDAKTGKELTDAEIWAAAGLSERKINKLIETKADEFFRGTNIYIDFDAYDDPAINEEWFEKTARKNLTDTNAKESVRLYINSNNELHMIRDIYSPEEESWSEKDIYLMNIDDPLVELGGLKGSSGEADEWRYDCYIPELNFRSADAKRINKEIEERANNWLDIVQNASEDSRLHDEFDWVIERYSEDRFSLIIYTHGFVGGESYTVYNFDSATGKELTDEEVLADFGVSTEEFKELSLDAADKFFCELYREHMDPNSDLFSEDITEAYINEQREDNLTFWWNLQETEPFISTNGQLCMARPITQLAGGDGFEYIIPVK